MWAEGIGMWFYIRQVLKWGHWCQYKNTSPLLWCILSKDSSATPASSLVSWWRWAVGWRKQPLIKHKFVMLLRGRTWTEQEMLSQTRGVASHKQQHQYVKQKPGYHRGRDTCRRSATSKESSSYCKRVSVDTCFVYCLVIVSSVMRTLISSLFVVGLWLKSWHR